MRFGIFTEDAIDRWFEDLQHYEQTLEEMAAASLDQVGSALSHWAYTSLISVDYVCVEFQGRTWCY